MFKKSAYKFFGSHNLAVFDKYKPYLLFALLNNTF